MSYTDLMDLVLKVAYECHRQGPGYAQQSIVLTRVGDRLDSKEGHGSDVTDQMILTCWHDLFLLGKLSWGYNLDNPNAPFFHVPERNPERDELLSIPTRAGTRG